MKRKTWLLLITFLTLILVYAGDMCYEDCKSKMKPSVSVRVFPINDGTSFGYEILINDEIFIRQEYLPVLSGNQPIKSRKDAHLIGMTVTKKIKANSSPALTNQEVSLLIGN